MADDTNLNQDMLLINNLTTMLSLSKTYHLPWDLGGAELVVYLVQWQCSVLVHLHHSSRRGISATTMDVYAAWLGGKPLLKRRGECPGWAVIWALGLGLDRCTPPTRAQEHLIEQII